MHKDRDSAGYKAVFPNGLDAMTKLRGLPVALANRIPRAGARGYSLSPATRACENVRVPNPKSQCQPVRLRVSPAAEKAVRGGHPWVYADAVREASREGTAGDIAAIYDRHDRLLALGLYDPDSPIRVRVVHRGKPVPIDAAFWKAKLADALARREGVFDEQTTGGRLVHGESDAFPGLVADRYDRTLVVKLYSGVWLPRIDEVTSLLREMCAPERIVLRVSRNLGGKTRMLVGDEPTGEVEFLETGLRFGADVLRGQKTGFFLDQRENRREVERLAKGREVLNAFSYSGGYSLYAARGGAARVVDLDESPHAIEASKRNFARNPGLAGVPHETVQADAFAWIAATPRQFDLVILDPPSLAKREVDRAGAIGAYRRLASLGAARLRPGGLLVASSCSAHVSAEEFFGAVRESIRRPFTELRTTRHPVDHPAGFPEAEYLKTLYLRL